MVLFDEIVIFKTNVMYFDKCVMWPQMRMRSVSNTVGQENYALESLSFIYIY